MRVHVHPFYLLHSPDKRIADAISLYKGVEQLAEEKRWLSDPARRVRRMNVNVDLFIIVLLYSMQ
jgi:hypothetical protein